MGLGSGIRDPNPGPGSATLFFFVDQTHILDGGLNLYCDPLRSPNGSPFRLAPGDLSPPRVRNPDSPFQSSDTDYETPLAQRIVRRLKRKRSGIQVK
jgi:hypothetical protein